jgi:hypothetical protein
MGCYAVETGAVNAQIKQSDNSETLKALFKTGQNKLVSKIKQYMQ